MLVQAPKRNGAAGDITNRAPAMMLAGSRPIPTMVCKNPRAVALESAGAIEETKAFSTPSVIA
jgi:hypothetical protein